MNSLEKIKKELRLVSTPERAKANEWFFKTEKGEYGFGDKFLGVTVPQQRKIAKQFQNLTLVDIEKLLKSEFHEERLTALLILVSKYKKGDDRMKEIFFEFYLLNINNVNNWDLVDSSAPHIVGDFLLDKKITLLLLYAKSENLWKKRIAIISTLTFIVNGNAKTTYLIADLLLEDHEDLIQKAVGWMLRETGKRVSQEDLEKYLKPRYKKMGRTALRYAIEKFENKKRLKYLHGEI